MPSPYDQLDEDIEHLRRQGCSPTEEFINQYPESSGEVIEGLNAQEYNTDRGLQQFLNQYPESVSEAAEALKRIQAIEQELREFPENDEFTI